MLGVLCGKEIREPCRFVSWRGGETNDRKATACSLTDRYWLPDCSYRTTTGENVGRAAEVVCWCLDYGGVYMLAIGATRACCYNFKRLGSGPSWLWCPAAD